MTSEISHPLVRGLRELRESRHPAADLRRTLSSVLLGHAVFPNDLPYELARMLWADLTELVIRCGMTQRDFRPEHRVSGHMLNSAWRAGTVMPERESRRDLLFDHMRSWVLAA